MGLFGRRGNGSPSGRSTQQLQIPDEYASRAGQAYSAADFATAANLYADAIDKLHTMYVIGDCAYRQPSSADDAILGGIVSAVGAGRAVNPTADYSQLVERSRAYLGQIAETAARLGYDSNPYQRAIAELR